MTLDHFKTSRLFENLNPDSELNAHVDRVKRDVLSKIPVNRIELAYYPEVPFDKRLRITGSQSAVSILRRLWDAKTIELQEVFLVLFLNSSNHIMGYYPHSMGGIATTLTDLRLVFAAALACGSVAILAAHNHPSGKINPSESDIKLTEKLEKAGELLNIKLLDHIILTKADYYSFADHAKL